MKYYSGNTFFGDSDHFEHRAKYGTANSTSSEKGTDNKKNNTPEYNRKYYEQHKDKWAKEGKYDPNGDDEDFKKVYGDDLKNPKLNMDTHIKGTDFYTTTNKDGQVVLINGDKKWTLPKGVKLTDEMKQALAGIDSHGGKQGDEFLGKMAKFLEDAGKKQPEKKTKQTKEKSSKKSSEKEEKSETPKENKSDRKLRSIKETYYERTGKNDKAETSEPKKEDTTEKTENKTVDAAQKKGQSQTEYYKKKQKNKGKITKQNSQFVKHSDDLGSVFLRDLF